MGSTRCPETSVNNYHTTPCNYPKDHKLQGWYLIPAGASGPHFSPIYSLPLISFSPTHLPIHSHSKNIPPLGPLSLSLSLIVSVSAHVLYFLPSIYSFIYDLLVNPEKSGSRFLRNVGACLPHYTVSHTRRPSSYAQALNGVQKVRIGEFEHRNAPTPSSDCEGSQPRV
jgi:hypothetical protein